MDIQVDMPHMVAQHPSNSIIPPFVFIWFKRLINSGSYSNGQSNGYSNGYSGGSGYDSYETGDKMANIGAGLRKQTFDLATLPKFEKNFYREAKSVTGRSEREVEDFRNKKEIRVSGRHIPRPVATFDEAGFPSMQPPLFHLTCLTISSVRSQRVARSWILGSHCHPVSRMAYGTLWS